MITYYNHTNVVDNADHNDDEEEEVFGNGKNYDKLGWYFDNDYDIYDDIDNHYDNDAYDDDDYVDDGVDGDEEDNHRWLK